MEYIHYKNVLWHSDETKQCILFRRPLILWTESVV